MFHQNLTENSNQYLLENMKHDVVQILHPFMPQRYQMCDYYKFS